MGFTAGNISLNVGLVERRDVGDDVDVEVVYHRHCIELLCIRCVLLFKRRSIW